jgi:hypothetical protein
MKKLMLSACLLLTYLTAAAHHSTVTNFTQEIITVSGVIEKVRYQNPHASVLIKNTDVDGKETYWLIETGARTTLERKGVTLERLKIGSTIQATGQKGRREYTMYLQEITFEDGTKFRAEPEPN